MEKEIKVNEIENEEFIEVTKLEREEFEVIKKNELMDFIKNHVNHYIEDSFFENRYFPNFCQFYFY
jgi:hypothetical protein